MAGAPAREARRYGRATSPSYGGEPWKAGREGGWEGEGKREALGVGSRGAQGVVLLPLCWPEGLRMLLPAEELVPLPLTRPPLAWVLAGGNVGVEALWPPLPPPAAAAFDGSSVGRCRAVPDDDDRRREAITLRPPFTEPLKLLPLWWAELPWCCGWLGWWEWCRDAM